MIEKLFIFRKKDDEAGYVGYGCSVVSSIC